MTESLAELFRSGGPPMFVIVFLAAPAWLAGTGHVLLARKVSFAFAVGLVGLVLLVGAGGALLSWQSTQRSAELVTQAHREELLTKGKVESLLPLKLSGLVVVPSLLLIVAGEVRRRRRGVVQPGARR